ncbi:MAG: chemotaxis protein CheX [Myxococcota bacterium]|nr:chemotaxis protein CheX [Myxococcota bacterium]
MLALPDDQTFVEIFNNITSTMLGMDVRQSPVVHLPEQRKKMLYCTGVLAMPGPHPITVAISSDLAGSSTLAAALFATELTDVELDMIQDTTAELANMLAGQIKGLLNLSQNLGLPKVFTQVEFATSLTDTRWQHIDLCGDNFTLLLSYSNDTAIVSDY